MFTILCIFLRGTNQNSTDAWTLLPHSTSDFQTHSKAAGAEKQLLNTFSLRWVLLPVLVAQVDGSSGQLHLSCLTSTSEEEHVGGSPEDVDIFWKNNGVMETQRGNLYVVDLEESLGGGNYTCHGQNGSLLNYTVVLIKEDNATRRKILLQNDQGRLIFVSQIRLTKIKTPISACQTSSRWLCVTRSIFKLLCK